MFLFFLIFMSLGALSLDSLILIWMCMEVSLMVLVPIMVNSAKSSSESAMKYFIVQSVASVLIVVCVSLSQVLNLSEPAIIVALLFKSGAAPLHYWLPAVMSSIEWLPIFLMLTVQKILPLSALSFFSTWDNFILYLYFFVFFCAMAGGFGGVYQSSIKKILAYSSIAHLSWMLPLMLSSSYFWLSYLMVYSMMVGALIYWLSTSCIISLKDFFSEKNSQNQLMVALNILSMGGIPPMTGFAAKITVMKSVLSSNLSLLLVPMITGSVVSLAFYMRLIITSSLLKSKTLVKSNGVKNLTLALMNLVGLGAPALLILFSWAEN